MLRGSKPHEESSFHVIVHLPCDSESLGSNPNIVLSQVAFCIRDVDPGAASVQSTSLGAALFGGLADRLQSGIVFCIVSNTLVLVLRAGLRAASLVIDASGRTRLAGPS